MLEAEMNKGRDLLAVTHQRTSSSPSQLEGCAHQPRPLALTDRALSHHRLPHINPLQSKGWVSLDEKSIEAALGPVRPRRHDACREMSAPPDTDPLPNPTTDTRTHVVVELFETEKSYVESLQILVTKYLHPLKNSDVCQVDAGLVDDIFYQVPAILAHHELFLEELRKRMENWDLNQKIGDLFLETFTKPAVIENYTEFINNWKHAKEAIKNTSQTKPAFARFLDSMAREHKGKLTLDSLLIMPVQRIPRYELLIQTLLKHTEEWHGDAGSLSEALRAVHEMAVGIDVACGGGGGAGAAELARLEALIDGLSGLHAPHRALLSHELVTITTHHGRKDRALFLFSDLLLITTVKRKSTTIRKPSQPCPGSIVNSLEGNKYRLLMKIPLDDLDIVRAKDDCVRKTLRELDQLGGDVATLSQMAELAASLHCPHSQLEETVREMLTALNRQLVERRAAHTHLSLLELTINTSNGTETIAVSFSKPEKRTTWEEMFTEAKQRLSVRGERSVAAELVCAVAVRKTRAGLQLACAAATPPGPGPPDLWVCNSDGYVGQVCVLSLAPSQPTLASCNGVSNARILCIAPVPGFNGSITPNMVGLESPQGNSGISISVEESGKSPSNIHLDSSSSSDEDERDDEEGEALIPDGEGSAGTMWLGTEDGCIHVYNSNDNIRTKKNKIKIQHGSPVNCIIYIENRVFVSLANGDITIYARDQYGNWNTTDATTLSIGSSTAPVTKMVEICGALWCTCHATIKILDLTSYSVEKTFSVSGDSGRGICCIAGWGLSVWISLYNSATVKLFHATTLEWITEINVAPPVTKMLAGCDDIIRQHKAACLRVTSLLACRDVLWVGTSAGVILTLPIPSPVPSTTPTLTLSGVCQGHTGQVRFLTAVGGVGPGGVRGRARRRPQPLVVVSGGDGYEDFRASPMSEVAGRDDSTNHLLLWRL